MAYTILLVDDDNGIRKLYRGVFELNGFKVFEALDGVDGLEVALKEKPDIILTGIDMPNMGGYELIQKLHDNPVTAKTHIMINSHLGRAEDRIKAREANIQDFIVVSTTPPIKVVEIARSRLENRDATRYFLNIDETALDAPRLLQDVSLPQGLICRDHPGEKMALALTIDKEHPGEFRASFDCPQQSNPKE